MEEKIQDYYKEYKSFINNHSLPDIAPIFNDTEKTIDGVMAYVDVLDLRKPIVKIYIDCSLFEYKEQYYKSILFHEFTHIYDACIIFKDVIDETELIKLMSTYSEYHASQIELLSNLGYRAAYNIFKKFKLTDKVCHKKEMVDVEKYLIHPLADATVILDKDENAYIELSDMEYNKNFVIAEECSMYYLGKYNICEKFANRKPHNFFHEFSYFQEDILELYKYLKIKDFKRLLKKENEFMLRYFDYFKFKY